MVGKILVVAAYYHKVGESDLNCICFKNELWCPARSRTSIQDQRSQKIIFKPLNLQGIAGVETTSTINSVLILIQVIRRVQLLPRINISHQSYQEMLFNNGNLPTNSYHRWGCRLGLALDEGTHLFGNSGYRFRTWRLQPVGTVGGYASMLVLSGWSFRNHHSTPFGIWGL